MVPMIGNIVTTLLVNVGQTKTWTSVASTTSEQTLTVPGLRTTDFVMGISKPTFQAGLSVDTARVSAADTLAVVFTTSGATVTPTANEIYTILVCRPENNQTDAIG